MKTLARQQDKEELLRRLRTLRADSPRRWGKMSVQQMVRHVGDACRMGCGEVVASDASGLAQRTVIKWIALYTPLKWPPGIPTRPEIDQQIVSGGSTDFATDLARTIELVEAFAARAGAREWPVHPIFGRLSASGWMRWGYLHVDHHLRQFGH